MKTVCVILADGFEEVEAITPIDYLRRAGLKVLVAGLGSREIVGAHQVLVGADVVLDDVDDDDFDCVVLPGGGGAKAIAADPTAIAFVQRLAGKGRLVAAICAAPALVLGQACGLLKGRRFTCYPGMENLVPEGRFDPERVVDDGDIITGRGPGAAGEFALAVVRAMEGQTRAEELAAALVMPGQAG